MKRYLRLYAYFLQFSFSKAMEFRVDFTFRIVMDSIYYLIQIALFKVIYLHSATIGGWTEPQAMIFVASFLLVDAIHMTLFSTNMWFLPVFVNKGELDYYLVRPVSSLFFLSLREFSANSFLNLIMAAGIYTWAVNEYPYSLGFPDIALHLVLILNGVFIFYAFNMFMTIPVFWSHSNRGLQQLGWQLYQLGERPDAIYKQWIRRILTTALPLALVASFPARILFSEDRVGLLVHTFAVTIAMALLLKFLWQKALNNYSSASS